MCAYLAENGYAVVKQVANPAEVQLYCLSAATAAVSSLLHAAVVVHNLIPQRILSVGLG